MVKRNGVETFLKDLLRDLKRTPKEALIHSCLSQVYYDQKKYLKALEHVQKAVRYSGKDEENYEILGNIQCAMGNFRKAINAYKKSLVIKPGNKRALSSLSSIYYSLAKKYHSENKNSLVQKYAKLSMKMARKSKDSVYIFLNDCEFSKFLNPRERMTRKERKHGVRLHESMLR